MPWSPYQIGAGLLDELMILLQDSPIIRYEERVGLCFVIDKFQWGLYQYTSMYIDLVYIMTILLTVPKGHT